MLRKKSLIEHKIAKDIASISSVNCGDDRRLVQQIRARAKKC